MILFFIFLKGSVISLAKVALGNKTKMFFLVNQDLGQKFTRNAKKFCFVSRCNFSNFYHSTLHEFSYHFNASSIDCRKKIGDLRIILRTLHGFLLIANYAILVAQNKIFKRWNKQQPPIICMLIGGCCLFHVLKILV